MVWYLKMLMIAFLCIHDCSLEVHDKVFLRDSIDYDMEEKDIGNLPTNELLDNEYQKIQPQSVHSDIIGGHKSSYIGQKSPLRKYHKRNGKIGKKRKIPGVENHIIERGDHRDFNSAPELKQTQRNLNGEVPFIREKSDDSGVVNHISSKKHMGMRRHPHRRQRKFPSFKGNNEYYQSMNEGEMGNNFDGIPEMKTGDVSDFTSGNYVLVPDQNQFILLKNLNLSKAIPLLGNEHFDNMEQGDQGFVVTIGNGPRLNDLKNIDDTVVAETHDRCPSTESGKSAESVGAGLDTEQKQEHSGENDEPNMEKKLREEIMNCTASGLQKYMKLLKNKDEVGVDGKSTFKDGLNSSNDNLLTDEIKSNLMNLNVSINGLVMNDNKPSKIHGNGTIKVHPGYADERERRAVKIPFFSKKKKYKQQEEENAEEETKEETKDESRDIKESCKEESKDEQKDYDKDENSCGSKNSTPKTNMTYEGTSGPDAGLTPKLSNEVMKMVSHMVRSNPQMKSLWPSLKKNKPMNKGAACNLRSMVKCSSRKQVEDMLRKAMASVNDLIQKEVQARSCVPLSEDLAEFYEIILEMHAKQAKRKEEREEMLIQAENLDKIPDDTTERSKEKQCKEMPSNDDESDFQDESLFDMMHARRLQFDNELAEARRRREAKKRNHELELDTAHSGLVRKLHEMYSPAFLKLSNIVENLQRNEIAPDQL